MIMESASHTANIVIVRHEFSQANKINFVVYKKTPTDLVWWLKVTLRRTEVEDAKSKKAPTAEDCIH